MTTDVTLSEVGKTPSPAGATDGSPAGDTEAARDEALAVSESGSGGPWNFLLIAGVAAVISGLTSFSFLVSSVSVLLELLFIVYFLRHLSFASGALQFASRDLEAPLLDTGFRPPVTVMVACRNEESVIEGLVARLLALDYPRDRLQLIIIDDASDDDTGPLLDSLAAHARSLLALHRPPGSKGAKSGALNEGLKRATGEIIVVFDADHEPHADVVRRLVRHFEDPQVAAVQGRCVIRNPEDSPLTRMVSIDYRAGYLVNEYGRQCLFELPAYGGANCAVRTSVLRQLGGWNPDTVTEDTDLTIQLKLGGWTVRYDVTAVDEEEGVVTLERYWRQRYRWARGHQQVLRTYLRGVWVSTRLSRLDKLETIMFLASYHLPVASAFGFVVLLLWGFHLASPSNPLNLFFLWTLLFLGPLLELGGGLLIGRSDRRDATALALFLPMFLVSVALCTKAWFDALAGRRYHWVKTKRSKDVEDSE